MPKACTTKISLFPHNPLDVSMMHSIEETTRFGRGRLMQVVVLLLLLVAHDSDAFSVSQSSPKQTPSTTIDEQSSQLPASPSRRDVLSWIASSSSVLLVATTTKPSSAVADDSSPLFRSNPLTNSLLEQIRIWDQAEADQLKYGGELERGDAGNKGQVEAYPYLLVPILQIYDELQHVASLIIENKNQQQQSLSDRWMQARDILSQSKYQTIPFKQIFNKYGDNIYYADPDRANLYLGGGATPKTEQSLAYLLRNDILTNIQDLQAELFYLLKHPDESDEDLRKYATMANAAMQRYIELVPPRELDRARTILNSTPTSTATSN